MVAQLSKMTRISQSQKLTERCTVLAEIVLRLAPVYTAPTTTETQRQLIETMIGAAIWYLPQGKDLWNENISVAAIRSYLPDSGVAKPKLTADHALPRKVAAFELLNLDWPTITDPASEVL